MIDIEKQEELNGTVRVYDTGAFDSAEDIYKILDELESEENLSKNNKSSFYKNVVASFKKKKINESVELRRRLQTLAGIDNKFTPATLTVKSQIIPLTEIPPWYDVVKYKLCGFEYKLNI